MGFCPFFSRYLAQCRQFLYIFRCIPFIYANNSRYIRYRYTIYGNADEVTSVRKSWFSCHDCCGRCLDAGELLPSLSLLLRTGETCVGHPAGRRGPVDISASYK